MERAAIFALVLVRSHLLETRTNECAKNGCIVSLVLINGVPGAGKSRLAEEVAVRRAHTTVVEIDSLRMLLHGWQTRPETMVAARDQAVELIGERLGAGDDVIVAQYVGRSEFVTRLRAVAVSCGASWLEVLVDVEDHVAIRRFRSRRVLLRSRGERHPEIEVADDNIEMSIAMAGQALRERSMREPITPVDGGEVLRGATQIDELMSFQERQMRNDPFAITDGICTIRSSRGSDRDGLLATRDEIFRRWLGPGHNEPAPIACIERDGIVVGWADFDTEQRPHLTASQINIGYALAPSARGEGYATRALHLLLHQRALVGDGREATLLIDRDNRASLAVARRAGFQPTDTVGRSQMLTRSIPPLVYCDGPVTIRPRRADDLVEDLEAKDTEQQQWLWMPEHRHRWSELTPGERRRHAAASLQGNLESFGHGPKWTFSVDGPQQRNVSYIDVDLANEHAPVGEANISYATHPAQRRRGYAPRAVGLIARFLADHTGARSAFVNVALDNEASMRVARAVGAVALDRWTDAEDRVIQRHRLLIGR